MSLHRKHKLDIESKKFLFEKDEKVDIVLENETSDIRGDRLNIALLFFLYLLQGIPLGLTSAIPMLLQNRGISYKEQAEFSFAIFPFSLKLLWAPIVDSLYWKRFGRRKTWLVPTQYLIAIFMLILSNYANQWLGSDGSIPNVRFLMFIFFALNFLSATQDIAVDGWALTMLKSCNVGHASTCNSVGQTAGYFLGYAIFIALESKDFCNSYIRSIPRDEGLITFEGFLWFWGVIFLITTTIIAILKKENNSMIENIHESSELSIRQTYTLLVDIVKMPSVKILIVILFTVKVTFATFDAVSALKLIDAGIPQDQIALLIVPIMPLQIILPLIISKYTAGPKPMNIYIMAIPYRILFGILSVILVYFTPYIISNGYIPLYYYIILIINYGSYQVFLYCMFVSIMAFFAKISDPKVGGTYMTLLNTICNLGGNWPTTVVLWLVDVLTWSNCVSSSPVLNAPESCSSRIQRDACIKSGGKCNITVDGYYIESLFCLVYGFLWLYYGRQKILYLQNLPISVWRVKPKKLKSGVR